jgi:hypothetical protein
MDEARSTVPYHESWNSREIAGHLVGWHLDLAAVLGRLRAGEPPLSDGSDYSTAGIDRQNAAFAAAARDVPHAELIERLSDAVEQLIAASDGVEERWFEEGKLGATAFRSAGYEHFGHHADALEAWLREAR